LFFIVEDIYKFYIFLISLLINLLKAPNYLNMWEAGKEKPQGQSKRQSQLKADAQSARQ